MASQIKSLLSRFPKELTGSVVVYPAIVPPEHAEGWKAREQSRQATYYPWRTLHMVDSSKVKEGKHSTQDAAINAARKLALSFNTSLFVEEEDAIREIAVEPEGDIDQDLLRKVRKLIAQAEGTDNDAERDTFLAKAQEWMVRHAMDESVVRNEDSAKEMVERNIVVGSKGAGVWAKRNLAYAVAGYANLRGWSNTWSYYSVMAGFREDVEYADMLLTSLLLQMEQELAVARKDKPEWTSHSTFRSNFMDAFVDTVSARLRAMQAKAKAEAAKAAREAREAAGESMTDVEASQSVALVLAGRKERVDEWVDKNHKFVSTRRNMGEYCGSSRQAGARAGERADLSAGRTGKLANRGRIEA